MPKSKSNHIWVQLDVIDDVEQQQSFPDRCSSITLAVTTFIGSRMTQCSIRERIVSENSVHLKFLVYFAGEGFVPNGLKESLTSHVKRAAGVLPKENISYVAIHVSTCKDTQDASGRPNSTITCSAWSKLHTSIANEVRSKATGGLGSFSSENPFAILADPTPSIVAEPTASSGSSQSTARPVDIDGIDAESVLRHS
jgi:hypothetical protein